MAGPGAGPRLVAGPGVGTGSVIGVWVPRLRRRSLSSLLERVGAEAGADAPEGAATAGAGSGVGDGFASEAFHLNRTPASNPAGRAAAVPGDGVSVRVAVFGSGPRPGPGLCAGAPWGAADDVDDAQGRG